jgi:hypothetical protein
MSESPYLQNIPVRHKRKYRELESAKMQTAARKVDEKKQIRDENLML